MKHPSSALHKLIIGMTTEEKKYFSDYIRLKNPVSNISPVTLNKFFVSISEMKEYDEEKLKKHFASILIGKSFKTAKSHLKELILDSLRSMRNFASYAGDYRRKTDHAEILASKGLIEEANAVINNLKKSIRFDISSNAYIYLADAIAVESRIAYMNDSTDLESIAKLTKATAEYLEKAREVFNLKKHAINLASLSNNNLLLLTEKEQNLYRKVTTELSKWLKSDKVDDPVFIMEAKANNALLKTDFEKYSEYAFRVFIKYSYSIESNAETSLYYFYYTSSFRNAARACILSKDVNKLRAILTRTTLANHINLMADELHFPYFLHARMMLAKLHNNNIEMEKYASKISELSFWNHPIKNIFNFRTLATGLSIVYHSLGEYKKAFFWTHKVITEKSKNTSEIHYLEFCKIFQHLIEYDMLKKGLKKDTGSFLQSVESSYEIMRKQKDRDYRFALAFLKFFMKTAETNNRKKTEVLKNEMEKLRDVKSVKHLNALFDFYGWVECRL